MKAIKETLTVITATIAILLCAAESDSNAAFVASKIIGVTLLLIIVYIHKPKK